MLMTVIIFFQVLECSSSKNPDPIQPPGRTPLPVLQEVPAWRNKSNMMARIDLNNTPLCVGAILNRYVIITSAECLSNLWLSSRNFTNVVVGKSLLTANLRPRIRRIARHVPDHRYKLGSKRFAIALEILEEPLVLDNNEVKAIAVWGSIKIEEGSICNVFGIGIRRENEKPIQDFRLKQTFVKAYNQKWCDIIYGVQLLPFEICSTRPVMYVTGAAYDLGSPLICKGHLVGITSLFFKNPTIRDPEVFKSVFAFWNFIKSVPEAAKLKYHKVSLSVGKDTKGKFAIVLMFSLMICC